MYLFFDACHLLFHMSLWHHYFMIHSTTCSPNPFVMTMKPIYHHHSGHNHQELIQQLVHCALSCETCSSACLDEQDVSMMTRCIELDRDCADICFQAARLLQRDAEIAHHFLAICEEMCRLCAAECNKHEANHCKTCAEVCQKCAEACRAHLESAHVHYAG
jgi:hypothetical protein